MWRLSAVIFWNMLWSTLLFVMLRVLRVLTRIVCFFSVTLCYIVFCSQCLSRWFSRKLVFLLFYNADIVPVSKFLYFFFFLDRATNGWNAIVTHLSTNATTVLVLQPWKKKKKKQLRYPLLRLMCFPWIHQGHKHIYICLISRQHIYKTIISSI